MKNYLSVIAIFSFFLMAIPSFSLINSDRPSHSDASLKEETFKNVTTETAETIHQDSEERFFKIMNSSTGEISEISEKDYVIGAVMAEMPASFEPEALKAQAVAAHTYAVRRRLSEKLSPTPELNGADFSDDSSKYQAFFTKEQGKSFYGDSFDEKYTKITQAVEEVYNKILVYNGEPIIAAFHSMSSGMTESSAVVWGNDLPYLVPVKSESDKSAPLYEETREFTSDEIAARFSAKYEDLKFSENKTEWFKVTSRSQTGTVTAIEVGGRTITGADFRTVLSLRSANFEIKYEDEKFKVITKGYGHGVGLSQYGANAMALQGAAYEEILKHYYVGAEIQDAE